MDRQLLMGNEAIALGAIRAGIRLATGYPGTPSSEVLETIARERSDGLYVEWSVNEKTAVEVAAGAAMSGARVLTAMKQVGLNVASDPVMSLNYVGVKGGMVIVVADDPGPISSQTEQDTRHFARFAKIAVFDPSSPEEAYLMIEDAFNYSEMIARPVIFRPTTRVCHSYASVNLAESRSSHSQNGGLGFTKDGGKWVIFPKLAYENHVKLEETMAKLGQVFSDYPGNILLDGGKKGIAASGVSWLYAREAVANPGAGFECKQLKVATIPLPESLCLEFLSGLDEVLVIEELDPVIERELIYLCGRYGLKTVIKGKLSKHIPNAGENSPSGVKDAILRFLTPDSPQIIDKASSHEPRRPLPPLPARPPVLCAGCPHRASFFAVKEAVKTQKAVFSGDIGCYTLGNAMPLDMVDTCLCMGAGIAQAQGIHRVEPDTLNFAFIGDSTFFHTGLPGVANAVYNKADIIIAVLDNSTTAMTGGQPNPGMGKTLMGGDAPKLSIYNILAALGVDQLQRVDAFDFEAAKAAAQKAAGASGVRAIIFEGLCVALGKTKSPLKVDAASCTGCGACVRRLGCPALSIRGKGAAIDPVLCAGCGLCKYLCRFDAIGS
ncbi:MAG: indolepyruvate ferredoxin oxidoreductase subunit alpha [Clostridiales bacterium]|jgi:indolepyruvate ferredoxin oxidoreductase alpha subunit|nr:indolepyruvate ferredoxin oxidoreductase subunit alpha [Clostridiales bacterium]